MEARQLRCEHRFRFVARGVSLVVAFLLCLGVFLLPLPATGSEVPSALAMANLPGLDLETNGNGHPLDGSCLVAPALVLRGAKERLAPILMTASATGLALVPLAVAGSIAGNEIEHPMAIVILGGLVTSTLLNLFVLPSLYLRFGRSDRSVKGEPAG
jgi:Cu/Ag efflux pump CusA